jgi:site-specific DNA recombinase
LRCGCCHGPYAITGRDRYACATRRQKGTCDNIRTITRQKIEMRVLDGLKERLLAPDLVAVFVKAFRDESKRQRDAIQAEWSGRERRAAELDRRIASIFRAIEDGLYEPAMKARLVKEERARIKTEGRRFDPTSLDVLLHP